MKSTSEYKYPKRLSDDLKFLSQFYGWNDDDKIEIRAAFNGSPEMVNFFIVLAAAHRAGYKQWAGNGFQRLEHWCLDHGLESPFALGGFDLIELDRMAI